MKEYETEGFRTGTSEHIVASNISNILKVRRRPCKGASVLFSYFKVLLYTRVEKPNTHTRLLIFETLHAAR